MTEQNEGTPQYFVTTKNYRRFGEMCDACRRTRVVGLGYGPPGTGKTESAKQYAQWELFKPFLPETLITFTGRNAMDDLYPYRPLTFASAPLGTSMQQCRTVFYTPPACPGCQPNNCYHQRSRRDRTSEPHHWTGLNGDSLMRRLKIVRFLRQAMCSVDFVLLSEEAESATLVKI